MEQSYKEHLQHIHTFIFDVDGVLTDGTILVTSEGELLRNMNVKDGYALKMAIHEGYRVGIISGGTNLGVKARLQGLGIVDIYLGETNKLSCLSSYMKTHGLVPEQVLYMGDDIPDLEVMQTVGLPCCPNDAVSEVKAIARYISHKNGGKGCVRDVIEQVLKVQGRWKYHTQAKYD